MPVDSAVLDQWLHGSDPRLVAWAADFARRRHDTQVIAQMPALLEHAHLPPTWGGDQVEAAQRRAVLVMLDALIQENADVPVTAIEAVAPSFPAQASVLIARHPIAESRRTLEDWVYGETGPRSSQTLARVAAMLLAKDPAGARLFADHQERSFVAAIVDASEEELHVAVRADGGLGSGGGSTTCGDFLGAPLAAGWPQVYAYDLVENNSQSIDRVVVDLDGNSIATRRFEENRPWGSCNGVEPLNPVTRHRLIAYWLGVSAKDMLWQPVEGSTIQWSNQAEFESRLGAIVDEERRKLAVSVAGLRERGLLRETEAAMPRLVVSIECQMEPCPLR
jgi:hypothetical protein